MHVEGEAFDGIVNGLKRLMRGTALHCSEESVPTNYTYFCTIVDRRKSYCCPTINGGMNEETAMGTIGAVYQPELIRLMKAVLDDAVAALPESRRTSTMMADMASQILARAAKGERDPTALKQAALSVAVECSHYSHDISPERRAI